MLPDPRMKDKFARHGSKKREGEIVMAGRCAHAHTCEPCAHTPAREYTLYTIIHAHMCTHGRVPYHLTRACTSRARSSLSAQMCPPYAAQVHVHTTLWACMCAHVSTPTHSCICAIYTVHTWTQTITQRSTAHRDTLLRAPHI